MAFFDVMVLYKQPGFPHTFHVIHAHIRVYIPVHSQTYENTRKHTHVNKYTHTHMFTNTHTQTHMFTQTNTDVYNHIDRGLKKQTRIKWNIKNSTYSSKTQKLHTQEHTHAQVRTHTCV